MDDTIPQDDIPRKQCSKCERCLPATPEFFQRDKQKKDGLRPDCKECRVQYNSSPSVLERKLAYNHAYYPGNRERILAQRKDNYHNIPEIRQYALDHNKLPKVKEYNKAYQKLASKRPEARERARVVKHRYRAREKSVAGIHTTQQIQDLLKRQKHKCYYCSRKFEKRDGRYDYQVEHTFPISRVAGTDIPANDISYLVLACRSCNRNKCNKFPLEFPEGGKLL